jgi:hypothetical protein
MADWRLLMEWDGEALVPANQVWAGRADRDLVVGEKYVVAEYSTRSKRSHDHFFAAVDEAFQNLPEQFAGRFRDSEHMRKVALVECGYYTETIQHFSTKDDAIKAASMVTEDGAVVSVYRTYCIKRVPLSQSYRGMGKAVFQKSKTDVLDWVAALIGVPTEKLLEESEAVA